MGRKFDRSYIMGSALGVCIAAAAVLLAKANYRLDNNILQSIINFLASVPTLILDVKLGFPQIIQNILFFVYWAFVCAVIAYPASRKNAASKALAVILALVLIWAQRAVQLDLERELGEALRAIGEALGGR